MKLTTKQAETMVARLHGQLANAQARLDDAVEADDVAAIVAAEQALNRLEEELSFAEEIAEKGSPGMVYEQVWP